MQAFAERLMDGCGLTNALAPGEFVDKRHSGRIFDIEGHGRLQSSTILAISTMGYRCCQNA
ncbi:protein of unknown function (plasmid) [Shinella sp. WSC3-e]|nr:protein of unknown function [Shinella sp. WSC3-e]